MVKEIPSDVGEKSSSEPPKPLDVFRKTYSSEDDFYRKLNARPFSLEQKQKIAEKTFSSIDDVSIENAKSEFQGLIKILDVYDQYKQFKTTLKDVTKKIKDSPGSSDQTHIAEIKRELHVYGQNMIELRCEVSQSLKDANLANAKIWTDKLISRKEHFDKYLHEQGLLEQQFTNLTDLTEQDWQHLEKQKLISLLVPVYTTDSELRRKMVNGSRAGEIIDDIKHLSNMHINCDTQLMLGPTINDGEHLDRSINDLAKLRPTVKSILIYRLVPTKFDTILKTENLPPIRNYTQAEAAAIVDQVKAHQDKFAASDPERNSFVHLSDEWYLLAKRDFPPAEHYGTHYDYYRKEHGIGMTRYLLDQWEQERKRLPPSMPEERQITMVTGVMVHPIIEKMAQDSRKVEHLDAQVKPIVNRLYGPEITAASLLGGREVLDEMKTLQENGKLGDLVLLPRGMLGNEGVRSLDGVTVEEFKAALSPARVEFVNGAQETVDAIRSLAGMAKETDLKDA